METTELDKKEVLSLFIFVLATAAVFFGIILPKQIKEEKQEQAFQKTIEVTAVLSEEAPKELFFGKKKRDFYYLVDSDDNIWSSYTINKSDDVNLYEMYENGAISEEKPYPFDLTNQYKEVTGTKKDALLSVKDKN